MFATKGTIGSHQQSTASNGWYQTMTLDQPGSDLANYPVAFYGTYPNLKTIANGGYVNNANGYDIVFYSDAGLTTLLDFERVSWDGATGTCEFHIRVATLTTASALVIYLAYGNTSITTDQQNITGTWNGNCEACWHLPDGSTLSLLDSTSNDNDLTNVNTATATTGKIDGAVNLVEASTQYLSRTDTSLNTAAQSYELWVNATTLPHAYNAAISRINAGVTDYCQIFVKSDGTLAMYLGATSERSYDGTGSHTLSTGTWYHIVMTYDNSQGLIGYVNGASDKTVAANGNLNILDNAATTIGYDLVTTPRGWNGKIDEVRIWSIALTADWVAASYSNQNDPDNFYSLGARTAA